VATHSNQKVIKGYNNQIEIVEFFSANTRKLDNFEILASSLCNSYVQGGTISPKVFGTFGIMGTEINFLFKK
jgi:hypothetical protein